MYGNRRLVHSQQVSRDKDFQPALSRNLTLSQRGTVAASSTNTTMNLICDHCGWRFKAQYRGKHPKCRRCRVIRNNVTDAASAAAPAAAEERISSHPALPSVPLSTPGVVLSNMLPERQLRDVLQFLDVYGLARVECVSPRMAVVSRSVVVEVARDRHSIVVGPGLGWGRVRCGAVLCVTMRRGAEDLARSQPVLGGYFSIYLGRG